MQHFEQATGTVDALTGAWMVTALAWKFGGLYTFFRPASTKNNMHPSDYMRTDDLYGQIKYILYSTNFKEFEYKYNCRTTNNHPADPLEPTNVPPPPPPPSDWSTNPPGNPEESTRNPPY